MEKKQAQKPGKLTRASLAIFLSRLKVFKKPKLMLEQYATDSETAATILWDIYIKDSLKDRIVADFGAGTGILGIGMLVLGAKKVYFIEKDKEAVEMLKQNISLAAKTKAISPKSAEILNIDIKEFSKKTDIVIQNPPFGTKARHMDKMFLIKALKTAGIIYSIHKTTTTGFIKKLVEKSGFAVKERNDYLLPIKNTFRFHRKAIQRIEISCLKIEKQGIKS